MEVESDATDARTDAKRAETPEAAAEKERTLFQSNNKPGVGGKVGPGIVPNVTL